MARIVMGRPYNTYMYPSWQQQRAVLQDYPLVQLTLIIATLANGNFFLLFDI